MALGGARAGQAVWPSCTFTICQKVCHWGRGSGASESCPAVSECLRRVAKEGLEVFKAPTGSFSFFRRAGMSRVALLFLGWPGGTSCPAGWAWDQFWPMSCEPK